MKQIIVRPTSSVAKYAETPISPVVAGRELSVDAVLTGNIRRASSRVRVTVQLIDVHSERSLWAETYDESSADVFAIEDSISARVAAALAVEMPGEQRRSLTRSNEAYELYQRGRFWVSRRTGETARRAAECYRKALAIDPDFALAHAGLAETYIVTTALGVIADAVPARTTMPLVREAAERALQIDPHMAEAHAAIGHFRFFYEWNWPAAQAAFLRAIALKPNYMMGHHWYAMALSAMGLADEALAQIRRAREIEPTSILIASNAGFILHRARRYEEALVELDNAVIMDAGLVHARYRLGLTLQALGRHAQALSEFEAVIRLGKGEALGLGAKAHLLAEMGERAAAEKLVSEMLAIAESRYVPAYLIAEVYAGLGDPDRAIEWLERAYEERTNLLTSLQVNRKCDPLRSDPRFQSIVDRVGLWRG